MKRLLLSALLLGTWSAWAAVIPVGPDGKFTLASAQTATGASANSVDAGTSAAARSYALAVQYTTSAGTATVDLEASCDGGTKWVMVASSGKNIDAAGTATDGISVDFPGCLYRANVTACSSCSVTVKGAFVGRQ